MFDNQSIYLVLTVAFFYGIATGSFVTCVSYRLPRGEGFVSGSSYCPSCHHSLNLRDLIPLFTWILQRGKCRYCKAKISVRYPLIELSLGVVFVGIVYLYGPTLQSLIYLALATELWIMIVTDLEEFIIPDSIQIAMFITGIAYCIWKQAEPVNVIISVAAGLSIGLLLHYGYLYLRKKDALGWGDVKFMAVIGTWIPLHDFVTFFLFAGIFGTVMGYLWTRGSKGAIFPFGPALAISLLINVLFPDLIGKIQ
jgi:prepilin signal peptidase PulO-like enzyme (type II secretory pathway)